jgi:hypothetical protein
LLAGPEHGRTIPLADKAQLKSGSAAVLCYPFRRKHGKHCQ